MLEPNKVLQEMKALQKHFRAKRDYVLRRLKEIGFNIKLVPDSTFYIWLDLRGLPEAINDGLNFFQQCLKEKVIGECMRAFQSITMDSPAVSIDTCVQLYLAYSSTSIPRRDATYLTAPAITSSAYPTGPSWRHWRRDWLVLRESSGGTRNPWPLICETIANSGTRARGE